jgi:hypothetical protein
MCRKTRRDFAATAADIAVDSNAAVTIASVNEPLKRRDIQYCSKYLSSFRCFEKKCCLTM